MDSATKWIFRDWERDLYAGCRRAWDLAARERGNWETAAPLAVFDLEEALGDALAVYYFPGMWNWSRAIVPPLATEAFVKSMWRQRRQYEAATPLSGEQELAFDEHLAAGSTLLEAYYQWAPALDEGLTPLQVEAIMDVMVPDPGHPGRGLLTPVGRGVDYRVRMDLAVVDNAGRNWVVDHRLVVGAWPEVDLLLLDEQLLNRTWAWEREFLATARGTIHNELRLTGADPAVSSDPAPQDRTGIRQVASATFRRTTIRRRRNEIDSVGERMAAQVLEMSRPGIACYPAPSARRCLPCQFRAPCLSMQRGEDPAGVLTERYRKCTRPDYEPGRLGSVWGFVPHRGDESRVRLNPPPRQPPES